jgi:hemerythrin-like metal-binding protein
VSIRSKVLAASVAVAAMMALFAGTTLVAAGAAKDRMADLSLIERQRAIAQDLQLQTSGIWQYLTDASLTRSRDAVDVDAKAAFDRAQKDLETLDGLEKVEGDKGDIKAVDDFKAELQGFWDLGQRMVAAYGAGKAQGDAVMGGFDAEGKKLLGSLQAIVDPIAEASDKIAKDFASTLSIAFALILALGLLAVVLVVSGGLVLSARLSKPLKGAASSLQALAAKTGDLTTRVDESSRDETGEFARAFNHFAETLRSILVNVAALVEKNRMLGEHLSASSRVAAESVADMNDRIGAMRDGIGRLDGDIIGSSSFIEQIMASINSLTLQVESQFKAIERSSASIEEIMASVGNVARIAQSRAAGMEGLVRLIRDGGEKVAATRAVILEISKGADEMLGMVDIIDSIASRTNLLAMNASIEAAHAGAAGRGFAVVAGEIRNLAATTASNASSIAKSLKATNEKVEQATASGEESERAFGVINREVTDFSKALEEVSVSMRELSDASTEILDSINTLVETSGTVKTASTDMRDGTSEILRSIHSIREVSASTLAGTNELSDLAATLSSISLKVAAFGNQNLYNSSILAAEVDKIDTGEEELAGGDEIDFGLDWSDILSVGVKEMDDQHKELFKRISALMQGMLGGTGGADIGGLLGFIADYVEHHFSEEEKLMRERGFPAVEGHVKLHQAFKDEFAGISGRIQSVGLNASLLILLQDRVINWLVEHIGKVDRQYGLFMSKKN